MKKLLAIFVFVSIGIFALAQDSYQDVVYLKNGGIMRGLIIEQIPNKSIKLQTADKNVFVYQIDEIEKMTKELNQTPISTPKIKKISQHGYLLLVEEGVALGVGDYGRDFNKLSIINGYKFNSYISLGGGTGFRYCFNSKDIYLPIFVDFRVNFSSKRVTPYASVALGSTYNLSSQGETPGVLFNPAVGIKFRFTKRMGLNVGIGYDLQSMDYFTTDYYDWSITNEFSSAISLNVGFTF